MSEQGNVAGTLTGSDSPDGLELLAEALLAYFHEGQTDADICRRHEEATSVSNAGQCHAISQCFPVAPKTGEHIVTAAAALPPWEESLWSKTDLRRWERLRRTVASRAESDSLVLRGI